MTTAKRPQKLFAVRFTSLNGDEGDEGDNGDDGDNNNNDDDDDDNDDVNGNQILVM